MSARGILATVLIFAGSFMLMLTLSKTMANPPHVKRARPKAAEAIESDSMQSIRGVIIDIKETGPWGPVLRLETGAGYVHIHTAPRSFLEESGIELRPGMRVEIWGAPLKNTHGEASLAAYVMISEETTIRLRDKRGNPLWDTADSAKQILHEVRTRIDTR
jgi:hypothetical protein